MMRHLAELTQIKRQRRAFHPGHERAAFKEQLRAHRRALAERQAVLATTLPAGQRAESALLHFASANGHPARLCPELPDPASYDVVVTLPRVHVLNRAEAFSLRAHKSAALKRTVLGAREMFASVFGLTHASTHSLAPMGRFVHTSPHPVRGRDFATD
ncbi:hypothetical protein [Nocardia sp. NRRL S-836]|uniref:hypothetical protein n=1 Tax=Nocardia sp. NRRL S-836 TaxID=1519492 RepID=UPI0006AF8CA7|nr:hypothetical protein [Nocardia sp. NRRL S-836]KOV82914.1 hypothetical protein ADL03_23020 [Nocardia sp. NRRL S-836]